MANGYIIVAACKDECTQNLSSRIMDFFSIAMGSKEIHTLRYQSGFAFIGVIGTNEKPVERSSKSKDQDVQAQRIFRLSGPSA